MATTKTKRKKKLRYLITYFILALLALVCLSIILYPMISNIFSDRMQSKVQANYERKLEKIEEADLSQYEAEANAYNQRLSSNSVIFDENMQTMNFKEYSDLLNPTNNGIMAYVEIPRIDVYLPVYHGDSNDGLEKGIVHLFGTSLPVGGPSTHAALSAHTGMSSQKLFTDLEQLDIGDVFYIHVLKQTLAYQVDQINVVEPWDTSLLGIEHDKDYVTLITCTPYAVNTHRLLVRGTRIPYHEAIDIEKERASTEPPAPSIWSSMYLKGILIGLIIASIIAIIIGFIAYCENTRRISKTNNKKKR